MISKLFKWLTPEKPVIKREELSSKLQAMRGSRWKKRFTNKKYTLAANRHQLYLIEKETSMISTISEDDLFNDYERINRKEFKGNY